MKRTSRRLFALLLALVMALSMIPMSAGAKTLNEVVSGNSNYTRYNFEDGTYIIVDNTTGLIIASTSGDYNISENHCHDHAFGYTVNRDGHFYACDCGIRGFVTPHLDAKDAIDGKCYCGYVYYDKAELTVLWLSGMVLSPRFNKDTTEYVGKLNYDTITETEVSAITLDARATVEIPEDLTIKEGKNVFEFVVTAEDGVTTKTYTVTVEK